MYCGRLRKPILIVFIFVIALLFLLLLQKFTYNKIVLQNAQLELELGQNNSMLAQFCNNKIFNVKIDSICSCDGGNKDEREV